MLNKNIVHLIDDIFWNMGFKTETQADKVMHIIPIARIMSIISIIRDVLCQLYQLYVHMPTATSQSVSLRRRSHRRRSNTYNMHKVMHIIRIILIISIIRLILLIRIFFRFVRLLDWRITCGRTRGH